MHHFREKENFHFDIRLLYFCISTAIPRLESTDFMNRHQIQRLLLSVKLEVPTIGPHTFTILRRDSSISRAQSTFWMLHTIFIFEVIQHSSVKIPCVKSPATMNSQQARVTVTFGNNRLQFRQNHIIYNLSTNLQQHQNNI